MNGQDVCFVSTAYLGPIQQYCKFYQFKEVNIEANENYLKQTYRNRCTIAAANGPLQISIPIEKTATIKCPIRDIRISEHLPWQHIHWNALVSAYNKSPFFDYYADDFQPFYTKPYTFLFDLNEELRQLICSLINLEAATIMTDDYLHDVPNDFRETIRPRHPLQDNSFNPKPYYQVFQDSYGFQPNLSIVDLLFNMGPESLLILRDSIIRSGTSD